MKQRRADFTLTLVYNTPKEAIKNYADAIYTMLETDPEVAREGLIVRFSGLSSSSLDVRVVFYTTKPALGDHLRIVERINYALLSLAEQQGVSFAYPSQSLYIRTPAGPETPAEKQVPPGEAPAESDAPAAGPGID